MDLQALKERRIEIAADGREIGVSKGEFFIRFPMVEWGIASLVRSIPGARTQARKLQWVVPPCLTSIEPLVKLVFGHQFYISADAIQLIEEVSKLPLDKIQASYATTAEVEVQGLARSLRPFQRAGVAYAARVGRCFIADEMGLGKTVQAIATVHYRQAYPSLIVCPASLKLNWLKEWNGWVPEKRVVVLNSKLDIADNDVVIVNYDVLGKYADILACWGFRSVVFDESHLIKNPGAIRTQASLKIVSGCELRLLLSGTPILNRPTELESQLRILDRLEDIPASMLQISQSNPKEAEARLKVLNEKLRATCFIRRNKAEVLTELPPKQRTIIPVEIDNRLEYNMAKVSLVAWLRKQFALPVMVKAQYAEQLVRIGALKKLAAEGKLKAAMEWIQNFLESGEKLIVFAHHHNIINKILEAFPGSVAIHGDMEALDRQASVEKFQTDPKTRLIVCSLQAAGVGHTLTASSNVLFLELGWHSAIHDQAEDRAHRIGQTNPVTAWYLFGENTIDQWNWNLIESKRAVSRALVDGEGSGSFNDDMIPEEFLRQLIEEGEQK